MHKLDFLHNCILPFITYILKECIRIGETYPFKRYGAKFYSRPNPICKKYHKPFSDGYWECVARHFTYHVYHDVGTCRMGPVNDPLGAVVDDRYTFHKL